MATAIPHRPAFIPSIIYKDNRAALKWLKMHLVLKQAKCSPPPMATLFTRK